MKIKRSILIPVLLILSLTIFVFVGLWWFTQSSKPASNDTSRVRFVIPKGSSASQIAMLLKEERLIRSALAFKIFVQFKDLSKDLKPGEYNIARNLNLGEVVATLLRGPDELWVTIPEGLRREEVAERVTRALGLGENSAKFRDEFLKASEGKEGYLFPDTYLFPKDIQPSRVVDKMLNTFNQMIDGEMRKGIEESGHTLSEIVTIASMVEREAKTAEERPIIAGILWKRLTTRGWLLQVDASVQYAVASVECGAKEECEWWPVLTREDLDIDSPYNTYKYKNLPPTPIANPGISSLKAAIFPEESDYWFYIHDRQGNVHFAKTIEEHNLNVSRYLGG